jgi:hypothetical protein
VPRFQRKPTPQEGDWLDLRDKRGKLCARIDTKRMVLEIKRSDRDLIAYFDLREYVELRVVEIKTDIE